MHLHVLPLSQTLVKAMCCLHKQWDTPMNDCALALILKNTVKLFLIVRISVPNGWLAISHECRIVLPITLCAFAPMHILININERLVDMRYVNIENQKINKNLRFYKFL